MNSSRARFFGEKNPSPGGTLARLLELLAPFGFREVPVTEVHDYKLLRE